MEIRGSFARRARRDARIHATSAKNLPPSPPTAFLKPAWRKLVGADGAVERRAYEVAVMMTLRDRLAVRGRLGRRQPRVPRFR